MRTVIDRFLASARCRNPNTRRAYAGVLDRVAEQVGADRSLAGLGDGEVLEALNALWGGAAASTWNQRRAAVASWLGWCAKNGYPVPRMPDAAERRPESADETRAIDRAAIERLLARRDVPLREKTLWRMLYETAARASEILALDIADLDLAGRRAAIVSKGGAIEYVFWATGTAHLLPRLLRGRSAGPLFLSQRRPGPARRPAAKDLCPETGRARLGYDRARVLLDRYTSPGPGAPGWDPPAAPERGHPSGRTQRGPAADHGQDPASKPTYGHALRQARRGGGRRGHRAPGHHTTTTLTLGAALA